MADEHPLSEAAGEEVATGFAIQSKIFLGVGAFLAIMAISYGLLSYEWAGTTMIALASGLVLTVGAYLGWRRPALVVPKGDEAEGPNDPWFPAASAWPFAMAVGLVLVANGLLLGLWLLLPAGAFLAFAIAGFIRQSRYRT